MPYIMLSLSLSHDVCVCERECMGVLANLCVCVCIHVRQEESKGP